MNKIIEYKVKNLVDEIEKYLVMDAQLKKAFYLVDRARFVPHGFAYAYNVDSFPLSSGQFISSPLTVAQMTMYLECGSADSVLEIGLGSGYQSAILSKLIRRVFSIERVKSLFDVAVKTIKEEGIYNINAKHDDGLLGWSRYAPYDRILFSCSVKSIGKNIINQLADGGILVAPILKENRQVITKIIKNGNNIIKEEVKECQFVPLLNGVI